MPIYKMPSCQHISRKTATQTTTNRNQIVLSSFQPPTTHTKVMNPIPYRPVQTGFIHIRYPTLLIPFRLKYRSVPANTGRYRRYWLVPDYFQIYFFLQVQDNTGQYRMVPGKYWKVPDKYRNIFYFFVLKSVYYTINSFRQKNNTNSDQSETAPGISLVPVCTVRRTSKKIGTLAGTVFRP